MKTLNLFSVAELNELIELSKGGAKPVTICVNTELKMRKTNNPYAGKIRKVSRVNCFINCNYESNVNKQREREGLEVNFQAAAPAWGERVGKSAIIQHKGSNYLEVRVLKSLSTEYTCEGHIIDKQLFASFIPERKKSARQGTDKEIIIRRYKFESLQAITIDKENYKIA